MEDAAYIFAENIARIKYADIPEGAIEATKKSILDTLGVTLGASGTIPGCRELTELVKEAGGKEESSIIAFGGKVPAWMAAFVNGGMAHGLDYDDMHRAAGLHPSACCVPSGFAIAERLGIVNGKEFITALALGIDMSCRIGLCIRKSPGYPYGWQRSVTIGVFSCAATSGKLLGLDKDKLVDAFGIAFCQAAGTGELMSGVGANLRGSYPAFPAKAGVFSALMAQRGITGPKNSLEGKAGLFSVYFKGDYDREVMLADLGERFEVVNVGFKPWPACYITHSYIDTILRIVKEQGIQSEDVEHVTLTVGERAQRLFEPLETRQRPTTPLDAKFSLPFTIAVALARRRVAIKDYSPEGLRDPLVLLLAQKVIPKLDKQIPLEDIFAGAVEISTKDGRVYQQPTAAPYGLPQNPLRMEDIIEKFRDCASFAAKPLPKGNIEKVIEMVTKLEQVEDVGEVVRLLS